jgi:hypothetical protein
LIPEVGFIITAITAVRYSLASKSRLGSLRRSSEVDARFILAVTHRQDLHKSLYTHAGNNLSAREAQTIANGVAKLRSSLR